MSKNINIGRRDFLHKVAGAGLISLGVPSIVKSSFGNFSGTTSANDRLTLGFIGVGWMGGQHLLNPFLGYDDVQVVAICDVDGLKRERARTTVENRYSQTGGKEGYQGCDTYDDFRELLARDDIDAVVIATPEHWHAIIAIQAAQAGKDIYCEKPLAYSVAEGRAMVEAINRYGRVFQTGSQQRSDHRFRFACELVRNGYIGQVTEVRVNVAGTSKPCNLPPEPVPDHLDWDMWLGPAPNRPFNSKILSWDMNNGGNWRRKKKGTCYINIHYFSHGQQLGIIESEPTKTVKQPIILAYFHLST